MLQEQNTSLNHNVSRIDQITYAISIGVTERIDSTEIH